MCEVGLERLEVVQFLENMRSRTLPALCVGGDGDSEKAKMVK